MITEKKAFEDAQVGDRVWDFLCGWGTIININKDEGYPMKIKFDNYRNRYETYTLDGKNYIENNPSLFWNEIKFKVPEKPFDLKRLLKELKVKIFAIEERNCYLYWSNKDRKIKYSYDYFNENPLIIYFSEDSIQKFMKKIKDEKITKEQFFDAYKKFFGGKIIC